MHYLLAALTMGLVIPLGQEVTAAESKAPPAPSSTEQWIRDIKNPTSWLSWGGDFRARNEYYNNAASLDRHAPLHEQDVIRYRGRVWASVLPVQDVSLNARVSAEPREWMNPSFVGAYRGQTGMEWRYGIVDNLNVKWTNIVEQPLSISAGRQDIMIGEPLNWWLVADGTPGDGSWTFFLDSVRVGYDAAEIKTKFDAIYINQHAQPDEWLPTINANQNAAYNLTEQDEQGVILYVSNHSLKNMTIEPYFIYKNDQRVYANGDNADIYTLGTRIHGLCADHWLYSAEGAYQFGGKQDPMVRNPVNVSADRRDISAYGVNSKFGYVFKDKLNNQVHLGFEYLSGDDPGTSGDDEMFDLLWGRWPRWSELYIYSYINESGGKIAQMNNIMRVGPTWSITPFPRTSFSATYNALFAPEEVPTRTLNRNLFSEDGNFRGHYLQGILKYKFNEHLAGHLWGECVFQDNYYRNRDLLSFLRAEVYLTF